MATGTEDITLNADWGSKKRGEVVSVDSTRAAKMIENGVALRGRRRVSPEPESSEEPGYTDRQARPKTHRKRR